MKSLLDIDEIDAQIIQILQNNPNVTHSKIAEQLDRSQPTIGLRIKKLEKNGLISHQFGVNLPRLQAFSVAKVQVRHKNPDRIFKLPQNCPFIINCFRQSGKYNLCLLLISPTLKKIDYIIDHHFRNKGDFSDLEMELLTGFSADFIVPIDIKAILDTNRHKKCSDNSCPCIPVHGGKE